MSVNPIRPTGTERTFGEDEIIVSKTDLKGHITYANEVFLNISSYTEDEILGKPHNIIRHPDMPRCVFKLLWDTLKDKREIFAYVLNMAKNGDHYWVFAHVTPTFDKSNNVIGYHSNRRLPKPSAVAKIVPIYRRLLEEEKKFANKEEGMAASAALLGKMIQENAADYGEFVFAV
jgi:PAS domain S-box-containing protein